MYLEFDIKFGKKLYLKEKIQARNCDFLSE